MTCGDQCPSSSPYKDLRFTASMKALYALAAVVERTVTSPHSVDDLSARAVVCSVIRTVKPAAPSAVEDHSMYKCRRRTYATAAGLTSGAVPAWPIEETPQQPTSQDTDVAEIPAGEPEATQNPAMNNEEPT